MNDRLPQSHGDRRRARWGWVSLLIAFAGCHHSQKLTFEPTAAYPTLVPQAPLVPQAQVAPLAQMATAPVAAPGQPVPGYPVVPAQPPVYPPQIPAYQAPPAPTYRPPAASTQPGYGAVAPPNYPVAQPAYPVANQPWGTPTPVPPQQVLASAGQVNFASQTQSVPATAPPPNPTQVYFGTGGPTDWSKLKLHPVRLPDINAPIAQAPAPQGSRPELASDKMEPALEPPPQGGQPRQRNPRAGAGGQFQPPGAMPKMDGDGIGRRAPRANPQDSVPLPSNPPLSEPTLPRTLSVPPTPPLADDGSNQVPPPRPRLQ